MTKRAGKTPNAWRKFYVAMAGVALAVPLVMGVLIAPRLSAQPSAQAPASAEGRPAFDAASIKPSTSGNQGTFLGGPAGEFYRATSVTARVLIATAYLDGFPPQTQLVLGGPGWIDSEHFDIEARAEASSDREQKRLMLQSLLEDRFKLVLHHETRQLSIYALVLSKPGKTGPQLTPHSGQAKCTDASAGQAPPQPGPGEAMPAFCGGFFMSAKPGELRETGNGVTVEMLGKQLIQFLDHTMVDRTGLTGLFDFTLEFAPQVGPGSRPAPDATASDPSSAPTIFVALQQQLGLKLEPRKGPVDMLVIDHVEEPSPN